MADDETNLPDPSTYDLVPVDHTPQFADAPVPKAAQSVQQPNVMGDISSMPGKVASAVGDVTGVSDAYKAATGQMTPEEAQMFALGALPMLAGGPEAKVAGEGAALGNEGLAYLLGPRSKVDVIGKEIGAIKPNGISVLKTAAAPEGYAADRLVYTKDGQIVGAMQVTNSPTQGQQVANTYVHPDYRRQGIATELNDFAENRYGPLARSEGPSDAGAAFRESLAPPQPQGIRAYHGSPYDFNQFDLSKIGTGEGAQAYGHGSYLAENPKVAEEYQRRLAPVAGEDYGWRTYGRSIAAQQLIQAKKGDIDAAIEHAQSMIGARFGSDRYSQAFTDLQAMKAEGQLSPSGHMYEVNINADPEHFLDWDRPQHEQSQYVQDILQKQWLGYPTDPKTPEVQSQLNALLSQKEMTKADADKYSDLRSQLSTMSPTGAEIYNNMTSKLSSGNSFTPAADMRSDILQKAGIAGIKYRDQGSRDWRILTPDQSVSGKYVVGKWPGGGKEQQYFDNAKDAQAYFDQNNTKNYVIFDPKTIEIVKKYGLAGLVAGGASHFSTVPVDHQPDFGDQQQGMATGGSVKATKTQANYRGGTRKKECALCWMFRAPSSCTAVRGQISPQALCDFFERAKDTKTLYVMRPLLNAGDVIAWAKSQGFKKTVTADDMHVTIAFSRDKVDHHALKPDRGPLVASGGKRVVKPLGEEGAVVLAFDSAELSARWKEFRDIGASWDWESYQPHVTITYDGDGMELKGIKPYMGVLRFGLEKFSELDDDAKEKIKERASGGRVEGVKIDATHDGPWMSCMSIDGATMYRNRNIPTTANIKGKTVDVDDMLLHHEVPEREDLENLLKQFKARHKREPNANERKGIYLKAHNRSGTPNERAHARKIGVDWKAWSAWCRGEESKIEKMKFTNQPKDADVKPIPHSHGDLEAEDKAA